jgi:NAD(P)-dependent dehydrogenase (short-subunit alcohol dehydrogenase family)
MNLFDLTNKVAIVTGASRGIGRSIAFQLARAGAKVVVSSRKLEACETVVKEIQAEGGTAMAISASIAIKEQLEAMVQKTRDAWGPIDILICNAASNPYYGPMSGMSDEVFNKIMHNNVLSSNWLCSMVYPDMKARKNGAIVLVSSVGGLHGSSVIGAYNISKAADMQLARNLAVEWGPDNIRVNCIAPGLIRTDFAKALTDDPVKAGMVENETPLRRIGDPDDIGGIAVLLASAAGNYITGQTIVADGGMMIR